MATTNWSFKLDYNTGTDFTTKVLSATITGGREKYLDPYAGGTLVFTINNTSDYASAFTFNRKIFVKATTTLSGYTDCWVVQNVDYTDYPGDIGMPTATITCADALGRMGRIQAESKALTQAATYTQGTQFNSGSGGPLPSDLSFSTIVSGGSSTASAQTYSGTVLNQLNLLNATERGLLRTLTNGFTQTAYGVPRDIINTKGAPISFGRTASASVIAYQDFDRIQNGLSFFNTATVIPVGLAQQTATNSTSVTSYGPAYYSSSTVDYDITQASGNANWIANSFADPTALRFVIRFMDKIQTTSTYETFLNQFPGARWDLDYTPPGGASASVPVVLEGWRVNMTPERTVFDLSFSPKDFYEYFILDSTSFGTLDYNRLGW